jgi:hypothetical protein
MIRSLAYKYSEISFSFRILNKLNITNLHRVYAKFAILELICLSSYAVQIRNIYFDFGAHVSAESLPWFNPINEGSCIVLQIDISLPIEI